MTSSQDVFILKGSEMSTKAFPNKEQKTMFLNMLKVLGGHTVVVNFSGGGDSGEIDHGELFDANLKTISMEGITFDWTFESDHWVSTTNKWKTVVETQTLPLAEILQRITEQMLEESGHDWYNNEGGQGKLEILLYENPPTITLNVGINVVNTEDHEYDYTDHEEEDQ
jgi:hypothetical protein